MSFFQGAPGLVGGASRDNAGLEAGRGAGPRVGSRIVPATLAAGVSRRCPALGPPNSTPLPTPVPTPASMRGSSIRPATPVTYPNSRVLAHPHLRHKL